MKLKHLIENVDMSKQNGEVPDMEDLCYDLKVSYGSPDWATLEERVQAYWLAPHMCTDTWVGMSVLAVDGVKVALVRQDARKSRQVFSWFSEEAYHTTRKIMLEIMAEEEIFSVCILKESELEYDGGEGYPLAFSQQILGDKLIYKGEVVKYHRVPRASMPDSMWYNVNVELKDGTKKQVPLKEVLVPYRIVGKV